MVQSIRLSPGHLLLGLDPRSCLLDNTKRSGETDESLTRSGSQQAFDPILLNSFFFPTKSLARWKRTDTKKKESLRSVFPLKCEPPTVPCWSGRWPARCIWRCRWRRHFGPQSWCWSSAVGRWKHYGYNANGASTGVRHVTGWYVMITCYYVQLTHLNPKQSASIMSIFLILMKS